MIFLPYGINRYGLNMFRVFCILYVKVNLYIVKQCSVTNKIYFNNVVC